MRSSQLKTAHQIIRFIILLSVFLTPLFHHSAIFASQAIRIAVLPFEINASNDLDFLKEGIQDMLNSRLSWKDQVNVIDKSTVKSIAKEIKQQGFNGESHALLAGAKLQADYVILGSLTILGNSTSIDTKLIDITGKQPPLPFSMQTADLGGVIPAINQFATTINETVFNRQAHAITHDVDRSNAAQNSNLDQKHSTGTTAPSQYHSPKKETRKEKLNSAFTLASDDNPPAHAAGDPHLPNPAFSPVGNGGASQGTVWKSRPFNHLINGIAIGDVNNDDLQETIIISDHAVFIYQFSNNRLVQIAEAASNKLSTFIRVDTGDINNNGISEIFITSLTPDKEELNSFIIEYNGRTYVEIDDRMPWYFKIVPTSSGDMLLGQKQKKGAKSIASSPMEHLVWNGKSYNATKTLIQSKKHNLLGTTILTHNNANQPVIISYTLSDTLSVLNSSGQTLWKAPNSSGGTMNALALPKESPTDNHPLQFFPLSLRVHDIDGDGKQELFHASNRDAALGLISKFKSLGQGTVTCASWNGNDLIPNWKTPQLSGRISDFFLGDINNDGNDDLVLAEITSEDLTQFSNATSNIVVYPISY